MNPTISETQRKVFSRRGPSRQVTVELIDIKSDIGIKKTEANKNNNTKMLSRKRYHNAVHLILFGILVIILLKQFFAKQLTEIVDTRDIIVSTEGLNADSSGYEISENIFITQAIVTSYQVLRQWNKSRPVMFMHIGKTGGRSLQAIVSGVVRQLRGTFIGGHFDWSHTSTLQTPAVITVLREPLSRAASHFYFIRKMGYLTTTGSISEILRDPIKLIEAREWWRDGQAAVLWLTGTHNAGWIKGLDLTPEQVEAREIQSLDYKKMCTLAVDRLKQTLWFGLFGEQERSLEMLQWQLGYDKTIKLPLLNATPHPNITMEDREILESLMPMDIWLYNYAELLFEARWQQYKTGIYREPELPHFPEINCRSTRYILACNKNAQLGPLYHVWNKSEEIVKQMQVLPKHGYF